MISKQGTGPKFHILSIFRCSIFHLSYLKSSLNVQNGECIVKDKKRVKQFLDSQILCVYLSFLLVRLQTKCTTQNVAPAHFLYFLIPSLSPATPEIPPQQLTEMILSWSTCPSQLHTFLLIWKIGSRQNGYHSFFLEMFAFGIFATTSFVAHSYFFVLLLASPWTSTEQSSPESWVLFSTYLFLLMYPTQPHGTEPLLCSDDFKLAVLFNLQPRPRLLDEIYFFSFLVIISI